jgi:uncharacterized membrane protein HdeD (DUF308 family)
MKTLGIILTVLGILTIVYTGLKYTVLKKDLDLGPIHLYKEENTPIQWTPFAGVVLLALGIATLFTLKKENKEK